MEYIQIPLPDSSIVSVPKRKAMDFCFDKFAFNESSRNLSNNVGLIDNFIYTNFKTENSKLVFISECIIQVNQAKESHKGMCKAESGSCSIEDAFNEVLFHHYELLAELGFMTNDQFTFEEIRKNDAIIDNLIFHLESFKEKLSGEPLNVVETLQKDVEELKGRAQVVGKKKWYGMIQTAFIAAVMKKSVEELGTVIQPYILKLIHDAPKYLQLFGHV